MSYSVKITPSGHEFEIEEEETILEAALRHGYSFPYGCRAGMCGSCIGQVTEGKFRYEYDELPMSITEEEAESGLCVFCRAFPASDLVVEVKEISAAKEIEVKNLPCRVGQMEKLANEVMKIDLQLPMVERLQFLAGQYIDILINDDQRRSFSMANSPHDDDFIELHIRKVDGGKFTAHVFEEMQEKDLLRLEGPFGNFFLREDSERPLLFIAGGTGFAPIKSILSQVFSLEIKRPIYFYWGARDKELLYMSELPEHWAQEHENFHYIPVLSEAKETDNWQGRTGLIHEAVASDFEDLSGFDVYASGRPEMIEAISETFLKQGMDEDHFYSDSFTFAEKSS
jgi:CDP-4-dehydro-6-deoxyglucose reductase